MAFGSVKSPYLPLKLKFLSGEKKVLEEQAKASQKQINQVEMEKNKRSIIGSLMDFAGRRGGEGLNLNYTLDN
jgi:hypothetical protein